MASLRGAQTRVQAGTSAEKSEPAAGTLSVLLRAVFVGCVKGPGTVIRSIAQVGRPSGPVQVAAQVADLEAGRPGASAPGPPFACA